MRTAAISSSGVIKCAVVSQGIKGDKFESVKDVNQRVEDLVVECFTQSFPKISKGGLAGDLIITDSGISTVSSSLIHIIKRRFNTPLRNEKSGSKVRKKYGLGTRITERAKKMDFVARKLGVKNGEKSDFGQSNPLVRG